MDLAEQFEAETGIAVDYQIIPADQYFNVLKTKLNAGEADGHLRRPDRQVGPQAAVRRREERGRPHRRGVDFPHRPRRHRHVQPRRQALRRRDLGHHRLQLLRHGLQQGHLRASWASAYPRTSTSSRPPAPPSARPASRPSSSPSSDGWHHVLWFPMVGGAFEAAEPGLADTLNANEATFAGNANMTTGHDPDQRALPGGLLRRQRPVGDVLRHQRRAGQRRVRHDRGPARRCPAAVATDYPDVEPSIFGFFPIPTFDNQLQPVHPAGPAKFIYSGSQHIERGQAVPGLPDGAGEPAVPARQRAPVRLAPLRRASRPSGTRTRQAFFDTYAAKTHRLPGHRQLPQPAVDGHRQGHGRHVHGRHDRPRT